MPGILVRLRPDLETLAAAAAGAAVFNAAGVPAATLSGAMVGSAALLAAGRAVQLSPWLRDIGMLLSGLTMGGAASSEMVGALNKYPASLAVLAVSLAVTMAATASFLRLAGGWDRATAFFAAAPGALSTVIAVAADTRADLLKVTMTQSLRLFMLVAVLPAIVVGAGAAGGVAIRETAAGLSLVALIAGGAGIAAALRRLGVAGPWIFGGMLASALLHSSNAVVGDLPAWLAHGGFGLVGVFIGTRFARITRRALLANAALSGGAFVIGLAISAVFAYAAAIAADVPFGQALVAFAPGGLEAMIVLGAALGLDPIYVGLHHLARFVGIGLLMPLSLRWIARS